MPSYIKGTIYNQMGAYQEAVSVFKEVLNAEPNNDKAYYQMGVSYLALRQQDKSINAFDQDLLLFDKRQ
jgi:tetratricopeptide (TPR) repeat protein